MGFGKDDDSLVEDGDAAGGSSASFGGGVKSFGSVSCSVCLDVVADNRDRSWAKLQCGHEFHLDCIGSAFNAKGAMQCPNCRKIEKGQWLYASGSRSFSEFGMDDFTHDEDLYDPSYSEMSFGVHWCPFGSLTRLPSFLDEEGEFSSTAYPDMVRQHAIYAEHATVSSAAHPCPYLAYFRHVHPSSSNSSSNGSEASNFSSHWSGQPVPGEILASYALPAVDLHFQNWEHHSSLFFRSANRADADQSSVAPVIQRSTPATDSELQRSGAFLHPPVVGHSSGGRAGSSMAPSMIPPYPGSNARARDRVQALQAYYQHRPSPTPTMHTPIISGTRRSSGHRGFSQAGAITASSEQPSGFYLFPSSSSGRNFQEAENPTASHFHPWERDYTLSISLNHTERNSGWGVIHQPAAAAVIDPYAARSSSFRLRHTSERTSSQHLS